jgi:hypothetical protein
MPPRTMKKVAIVQSNYIHWKGYFDLVNSVDEFILYDDVPLWIGLETQQDYVIERCRNALGG